ncbi:restriction endonuclease subunit S [Enterococcus faecium]|uniref:restriction endonuclease subunit S n=1 Tax=Enterococcus faecium TaxID=1352 RepID=UPI000CF321AD|nr:restriction endonuclease subunit S [Enterococcus faecium]PQH04686.1 restriction endonuclease subunit S [Enterococcus faecium]
MSNDTQPEIRFPGFTEAWEQRKLDDVVEFYSGLTYSPDNVQDDGTFVLRSSNVKNGEIIDADNVYVSHEVVNSGNVQEGDVIVVVRNGSRDLIGKHAQIKRQMDNTVIGAFMTGVRSETPDFTNAMLDTQQFAVEINKNLGATINQITTGAFKKMQFVVPKDRDEREAIGTFFRSIDDTITLHQRKLDLLKETKKGFLQKMFPKNGAKVPEIRFPGFTEDWEQRKLGELATIVRGASPRPIQDPKWFDTESDVGWLRIADVTEQDGRIYYLEQHISKLGQEKTRVLVEPHLLLSIAATVGKPVVNYVKTGVHDGFLIFLNAIFDREFMFQWLEMFRPKWQKYGQPGSQVNLNSELVRNQEILIPNNEEQQKIGSFFKQLDDTIALHQRELDVLKETKKGFLQKMFV